MRAVSSRPQRRHRRGGRSGQALVELAVVAPVLVVLLLGTAQVGVIVYDQVTVDTAAREGARVGSEQPNGSQAYVGGAPASQPYPVCPSTGTSSNPVCNAVWNASGLLNGRAMAVSVAPQPAGATPASCSGPSSWVADGYVQVNVAYDAPVFVPVIGQLFQTSPGTRRVTAVVTARVEPCTLTQGR
jgi:Flp pilus assembly protein TadG